jgi:hypothetical protein
MRVKDPARAARPDAAAMRLQLYVRLGLSIVSW